MCEFTGLEKDGWCCGIDGDAPGAANGVGSEKELGRQSGARRNRLEQNSKAEASGGGAEFQHGVCQRWDLSDRL